MVVFANENFCPRKDAKFSRRVKELVSRNFRMFRGQNSLVLALLRWGINPRFPMVGSVPHL